MGRDAIKLQPMIIISAPLFLVASAFFLTMSPVSGCGTFEDFSNLPEELKINIVSNMRAKDIMTMRLVSHAAQNLAETTISLMKPKEIAEMMVEHIDTCGHDKYQQNNDYMTSVGRLFDPLHLRAVAKEFNSIGRARSSFTFDDHMNYFTRNGDNMTNDLMVEILAADCIRSYRNKFPKLVMRRLFQFLQRLNNQNYSEGVKRILRTISNETDILKDAITAADRMNDWTSIVDSLRVEMANSPGKF